jgi:hypothetical protein
VLAAALTPCPAGSEDRIERVDSVAEQSASSGLVPETVAAALGRSRREDATAPGHGGPRGNAHLTAWTGLLLFILFAAEGVTILSIGPLITWHVAIGAILIPPTLLKTATTGWRIARYYAGNAAYVQAGPPPTLLRILGPFVIATSVAVLGTGVVLIVVGPDATGVNWLLLHKLSFFAWLAAMGAHVVGRLIPGLLTVRDGLSGIDRVPGWFARGVAIGLSVAVGVGLAFLLVHHEGTWSTTGAHRHHRVQ